MANNSIKKINNDKPIQINAMYMASITVAITLQSSCVETITHCSLETNSHFAGVQ